MGSTRQNAEAKCDVKSIVSLKLNIEGVEWKFLLKNIKKYVQIRQISVAYDFLPSPQKFGNLIMFIYLIINVLMRKYGEFFIEGRNYIFASYLSTES